MPLHPKLIEIVRCPACRSPLRVVEPETSLACTGCPRTYPIVDGIPILLLDRASGAGETV